MKIYTLTLNPAYDVHAFAREFTPFAENLAQIQSREAGGKGVNISRALCSGQIPNTAIVVLGKENGEDFKNAVSAMDCVFLEKEGRIRENLTLHCPNTPETRISFAGFTVDDRILQEVSALLPVDDDTYITFTGRVASGMSMDAVKAFLQDLRNKGAKIVLDSKSFSLEDIFQVQPWLIKPNQEEISEYLGCEIGNMEQAIEKSKVFAEHGIANVMVSLGQQGALLLHDGNGYIATPPVIDAVSTIGAGDSTIAGFLAGVYGGQSPDQCLKTAVAYGTAACLTAGTLPPEKENLLPICNQVVVKRV